MDGPKSGDIWLAYLGSCGIECLKREIFVLFIRAQTGEKHDGRH